ncbi:MAG: hypothetical protein ACR2PX_05200 [Endozoicomonas sp.]
MELSRLELSGESNAGQELEHKRKEVKKLQLLIKLREADDAGKRAIESAKRQLQRQEVSKIGVLSSYETKRLRATIQRRGQQYTKVRQGLIMP